MSTVDREVILEALSALLETTVKPYNGLNEKTNPDELNIFNLLPVAFSKHVADLSTNTYSGQDIVGGFTSNQRKEMFVNMVELLDPHFDKDFKKRSDNSICMRGGEQYKRPCGWYRIALKVLDKYPDGNSWLGVKGANKVDMKKWRSHSVAGEWPVSYHGTSVDGAEGVVKYQYKAGPRQLYGRGIYSTYDIDQASSYSKEFTYKKKRYRVIMQNRINPVMRKVCARKDYWLIEIPDGTSADEEKKIVEKSIRPYGILIKEM